MQKSLLALTLGYCALIIPAGAQQIALSEQIWSGDVIRAEGQPLVPLFDGWFTNPDGTHSLCFSYFNMNTEESFDIPVGELNMLLDERFADALIPTHFDPLPPAYRHVFCAFTVDVPADFGVDDRIVWRLTSNGQTLEVPGKIIPPYVMDEPASGGRGEIAPLVALEEDGEAVRGRRGIHREVQANVGEPLTLGAWIEHEEPEVWVGWAQHSGPGNITFDRKEYEFDPGSGPATVAASFSAPGVYVIRMQTIESTASFEFYCCHTNAFFHVTVGD